MVGVFAEFCAQRESGIDHTRIVEHMHGLPWSEPAYGENAETVDRGSTDFNGFRHFALAA